MCIWRASEFLWDIRMCFGADEARLSPAKFRRSPMRNGCAGWAWSLRPCGRESVEDQTGGQRNEKGNDLHREETNHDDPHEILRQGKGASLGQKGFRPGRALKNGTFLRCHLSAPDPLLTFAGKHPLRTEIANNVPKSNRGGGRSLNDVLETVMAGM